MIKVGYGTTHNVVENTGLSQKQTLKMALVLKYIQGLSRSAEFKDEVSQYYIWKSYNGVNNGYSKYSADISIMIGNRTISELNSVISAGETYAANNTDKYIAKSYLYINSNGATKSQIMIRFELKEATGTLRLIKQSE